MAGLLDPTFKEVRIRTARSAKCSGPKIRRHRRLHGHRGAHHARRETQARLSATSGDPRRQDRILAPFKDDGSGETVFECVMAFITNNE